MFSTATARAADPFAEYIRSADPKSPAEEQKGFHLPPGFEIQLVASEPEMMTVAPVALAAAVMVNAAARIRVRHILLR